MWKPAAVTKSALALLKVWAPLQVGLLHIAFWKGLGTGPGSEPGQRMQRAEQFHSDNAKLKKSTHIATCYGCPQALTDRDWACWSLSNKAFNKQQHSGDLAGTAEAAPRAA
jgi:hypothetical protein